MKTDHLRYPVAYGVMFNLGKVGTIVVTLNILILILGVMVPDPLWWLLQAIFFGVTILCLSTAAVLGAIEK